MGTLTRQEFLDLSWAEQKEQDLRKVLDPETDVDLTANCIMDKHQDDSASMVIYSNGVWCFGCKQRLWPDQFLRKLGDLPLNFERGTRRLPAPKYIPLAVVETYALWLNDSGSRGHYYDRGEWLEARGLNRAILELNQIGHSGEAFTIPIFDHGIVRAIRYRRDDELAGPDRPKYWGTPGANEAMLYTPLNKIPSLPAYGLILCEGELDALRLAQEGYPAISLTNGCNALKDEHVPQIVALARRIGLRKITICYDQDEPGRQGAQAALEKLWAGGLTPRVLLWPRQQGKDVTEYLKSVSAGTLDNQMYKLWQR